MNVAKGLMRQFPDTTKFVVMPKRDWEKIRNWINTAGAPEEVGAIAVLNIEVG